MVIPPCGSCFRNDAELAAVVGGSWAYLCRRCASEGVADRAWDWKPLLVGPLLDGCTEDEVRRYVRSQRFTFARTMPDIPHYYVVLHRSTDPLLHLRAVNWIRENGQSRRFARGKPPNHYWTDGNYEYWALPQRETILNRRDLRESGPDGRRLTGAERNQQWRTRRGLVQGTLAVVWHMAIGLWLRTWRAASSHAPGRGGGPI
jgi:hypothetical protein